MLRQNQTLKSNSLAVSLENASVFERYLQVMAFWTPYNLSDEDGWEYYQAMYRNLKADPAIQDQTAHICTHISNNPLPQLLLGVEDARILGGDLERLELLYRDGIRILTLLWKGETCIGGSHDTKTGLTDFGKAVTQRAIELGMLPDISHASVASAQDVFEIAQAYHAPVIASHSNAYAVCPVSRNLRDDQIVSLIHSGGIIGLNLYQGFLSTTLPAKAETLLPHIEHFLSLGAKDALCLGGDMDGCDLPPDIPILSQLPILAELLLRQNYSEELVHAIFYQNAYRFAQDFFAKRAV